MSVPRPDQKKETKASQLVSQLQVWFVAHARDLPWRRTHDPYAIWVSEIMLQQTQVKTVIPFWERWLRELPTIAAAAQAPADKIHKLWEGLGYYTRVRNLQAAAQVIVAQHHGVFPQDFAAVLELPGIGRYTAGAICSIAFNQPTPILDGNVIRVLSRLFGLAENPNDKAANARLWQLATELVAHAQTQKAPRRKNLTAAARGSCSMLNQSLMELGALVCTPRQPQCEVCPVKTQCVALRENRQEELPNLGKRAAATAKRFVALVVERNGKFLVRQRPAGVVNAHLWEFPNHEISVSAGPGLAQAKAAAAQVFGFAPAGLTPLCTVKHAITRYRITLEAYLATLDELPARPGGHWQTPAQLQALAFTSAHRKIVRAVLAGQARQTPGAATRRSQPTAD